MTVTKLVSGADTLLIEPLKPIELEAEGRDALVVQRIGESCTFDTTSDSLSILLNGEPTTSARLLNGDEIEVGGRIYRYESDSTYTAPKGKKVASSFDGVNASSIDLDVAKKMNKAVRKVPLSQFIGARFVPLTIGIAVMVGVHYMIISVNETAMEDIILFAEGLMDRVGLSGGEVPESAP